VSAAIVSIRVVDGDIAQSEAVGSVDAEHLNRRVLDREAADTRTVQLMSSEELGLGLPATTLTVPPARAVTIENRSLGPFDTDAGTGD
jgi:hypothetical protein